MQMKNLLIFVIALLSLASAERPANLIAITANDVYVVDLSLYFPDINPESQTPDFEILGSTEITVIMGESGTINSFKQGVLIVGAHFKDIDAPISFRVNRKTGDKAAVVFELLIIKNAQEEIEVKPTAKVEVFEGQKDFSSTISRNTFIGNDLKFTVLDEAASFTKIDLFEENHITYSDGIDGTLYPLIEDEAFRVTQNHPVGLTTITKMYRDS